MWFNGFAFFVCFVGRIIFIVFTGWGVGGIFLGSVRLEGWYIDFVVVVVFLGFVDGRLVWRRKVIVFCGFLGIR